MFCKGRFIMTAANASVAADSEVANQVIPKAVPKFFRKYVGNGHLIQRLIPYETSFIVRFLNSVYNTAPLFKWSLSVVPLCGILSGNPPVDKIDINSSFALTATGIVWFFYALLIKPQNAGSRSLAAVNFCLAFVNGYNCYRYLNYQRTQKRLGTPVKL
uniref:Mitochondrial pyruvate carrier n=1 Tax=Lygus hesperus TaxID=30085 RepID=A0A0A9WDX1_LYGHE